MDLAADSRHSRTSPSGRSWHSSSTTRPCSRPNVRLCTSRRWRGARREPRDVAVARYSEHSVAQDLEPLTIDEVTESSPLRIFRAAVTAAFMLEDERDFRTAVEL